MTSACRIESYCAGKFGNPPLKAVPVPFLPRRAYPTPIGHREGPRGSGENRAPASLPPPWAGPRRPEAGRSPWKGSLLSSGEGHPLQKGGFLPSEEGFPTAGESLPESNSSLYSMKAGLLLPAESQHPSKESLPPNPESRPGEVRSVKFEGKSEARVARVARVGWGEGSEPQHKPGWTDVSDPHVGVRSPPQPTPFEPRISPFTLLFTPPPMRILTPSQSPDTPRRPSGEKAMERPQQIAPSRPPGCAVTPARSRMPRLAPRGESKAARQSGRGQRGNGFFPGSAAFQAALGSVAVPDVGQGGFGISVPWGRRGRGWREARAKRVSASPGPLLFPTPAASWNRQPNFRAILAALG